MRELATVQKIGKIEPIEGADRIELAHVLGWQCVVNKGQFHPMDLAVYFEIDSFLPVRPEFEFLRDSSFRKSEVLGEGFRLKTMRFRGMISQGLLLPVSSFPEIPEDAEPGMNVSELLGVRKWEVLEKATAGGTMKRDLPADVPHTDEKRIQAKPGLLQDFAGLEYYITTKLDGSSHSVSLDEEGFHVTSHNFELEDDGKSSFYKLVRRDHIEEGVRKFYEENGLRLLTIQGEFCAPNIQKNRLKLTRPEWYVFTVRENGKRVGLKRMQEVCEAIGLNMVPVEEIGMDLPSKYPTVDDMLKRAEGDYPRGGKKEGIVVRPTEPVYCQRIFTDLSMKVVNNQYLLKNEK